MNRFVSWAFMFLPWEAFSIFTAALQDAAPLCAVILGILVAQLLVINIRRKQVGLDFQSTLKAIIPGIGYTLWQRLYFAKPYNHASFK